jgi:hypothetical protein
VLMISRMIIGVDVLLRVHLTSGNSSADAWRKAIRLCARLRRIDLAQLALGGSRHERLFMVADRSGGDVGRRFSDTRAQNTVSHARDTTRVDEGVWCRLIVERQRVGRFGGSL